MRRGARTIGRVIGLRILVSRSTLKVLPSSEIKSRQAFVPVAFIADKNTTAHLLR
jgi:hypothetical protein